MRIECKDRCAKPQPEGNPYEVLKLGQKVVIPLRKSRVGSLFGDSPNLPLHSPFSTSTSLSGDREGYKNQLKQDLQDIRQKLYRVHTSHANKCHERGHVQAWRRTKPTPGVNHPLSSVGRSRLRLMAGQGHRRCRYVYSSARSIIEKWPIWTRVIRVHVLGAKEELPSDLRRIVEATDEEGRIEGSVLVALCKQRSEKRGSGCDALQDVLYLPRPKDYPLKTSPSPVSQVRRYSCRSRRRENVYQHSPWRYIPIYLQIV